MHKVLFLLFLISAISVMPLRAQRVQYFSNVSKDSVAVQSLQGIDLSVGLGQNAQLGYFNELKLGRTFTLTFSGNVIMARVPVSYDFVSVDSTGNYFGGEISNINYGAGFLLGASVEPRWYFDYIKRSVNFRNTKLNSGFFLNMPVSVTTGLINPSKDLPYGSNFFNLNPLIEPGIGYRYAIGKNFFLESVVSARIYGLHLGRFYFAPNLKIRGAITF